MGECEWGGGGVGERRRSGLLREEREVTNSFRRDTSAWSYSMSENGAGALIAEREGDTPEATSVILSANWASSSTDTVSLVEANTILTLVGRRCKNSSRRKAPSVAAALSPSNWCMRRSSCVGLRSPSSSA